MKQSELVWAIVTFIASIEAIVGFTAAVGALTCGQVWVLILFMCVFPVVCAVCVHWYLTTPQHKHEGNHEVLIRTQGGHHGVK